MHTAIRMMVTLMCVLALFGAAHWLREIYVMECTRAGNTAPACELRIAKRGSTSVNVIESGALKGAATEHRRVYDNDGSFVGHFYLAVMTDRGNIVSSSGSSKSTVDAAAAQINAFVSDASKQKLDVSLDNALMCYGIAAMMSLLAAYVIHQMRH